MALNDGVLTDKERQILIKKATELGIDQDEFEMVLEFRLGKAKESLRNSSAVPNDNVIQSNLKVADKSSMQPPNIPAMNMGNDNVVKAEIDASTKIHNDNSLKVKGNFVAQQTVINQTNTSGAELVRLIGSFFERGYGSKKQIEDQLESMPDNLIELIQTLSELCRFITREIDKIYTGKKPLSKKNPTGVLSFGKNNNDPIFDQIEFAQKILDKIHKVAFDSKDQNLTDAVSKLDQIVSRFPEHIQINSYKDTNIDKILMGARAIKLFSGPLILFGLGLTFKESFYCFPVPLILSGILYASFVYPEKLINAEMDKLLNSHQVLISDYKYCNELVEKIKSSYQS